MLYILLALLFYTAVIMFGTIASRNTDSNVVAAIINVISTIIPVAVVIPLLNRKLIENGKFGIIMAVLGGIAVALFTMALSKSLATNKVAIASPIIFGGAIFLSSILSLLFLKEKMSTVQAGGLIIMGIGLLLVIYAKASGN